MEEKLIEFPCENRNRGKNKIHKVKNHFILLRLNLVQIRIFIREKTTRNSGGLFPSASFSSTASDILMEQPG
jgi:hypothetical protein